MLTVGYTVVIRKAMKTAISLPDRLYKDKEESGLTKDSVLIVSQLSAIDKKRLVERAGKLEKRIIEEVEKGIKLVLGMK